MTVGDVKCWTLDTKTTIEAYLRITLTTVYQQLFQLVPLWAFFSRKFLDHFWTNTMGTQWFFANETNQTPLVSRFFPWLPPLSCIVCCAEHRQVDSIHIFIYSSTVGTFEIQFTYTWIALYHSLNSSWYSKRKKNSLFILFRFNSGIMQTDFGCALIMFCTLQMIASTKPTLQTKTLFSAPFEYHWKMG